jgi:hypothetical protein
MNKKTSLLLVFIILCQYFSFAQDTLRNLQNSSVRIIDNYSAVSTWGYFTGHNHRYTEEYAEKYYINGTRVLIGVVSEHAGVVTNINNNSQFKGYTVGANKLPGTLKASKNVKYGELDLSGNPMVTIFPTPATVSDSFFVSFNLTDYAHGGFDGDTIGLLYGTDGSRSTQDLAKFGRNAVRHHSHDAPLWKDFYSQNFTPVATHFALFPIMSASTGVIDDLSTEEFSITKIYPNPFTESFTLQLKKTELSKVTLFFYNNLGQLIKSKILETSYLGLNGIQIDCHDLPPGNYIVFIKGETSGIGTQLIKL